MDKRQQILAATAELIAEHGLQSCPMSMVAKHAGCGAGTIYRYFETKEELVRELFAEVAADVAEACLKDYDKNAGIKQRFFVYWGNFYHWMRENPQTRALMEQLGSSPAICENHRQVSLQCLQGPVQELLEEGRKEQLIKNLPDEVLATMTLGALMTMCRKQHLTPGTFKTEVNANDLITLCWDAIKA
ncbi:MAG: hypothetical protein CMI08_04010 [Oceanospirillaceae bacterium]|uniref:TetR/AcrR family transcriptional regulator n=1 Tax=unclassified Thalassolituus TaxID=2624967 RepID=UPI000C3B89F7|nr:MULTISPECIES: TetR/AcrR family transcriptional regulator [unclassified Thalassolituus]MAS26425.1 hypothetical protein [Oceanospirillaceae bacterium]MAX98359.1 hypothetical protein [Oceanospirillaceae bacterium]MBS54159.1 hypothetical protein [Oceanospirillaceae bacterium]|tara:strand:+ start:682 stop:1245 length:564 start_codon:yes stop_codon:yes gene_type:complete